MMRTATRSGSRSTSDGDLDQVWYEGDFDYSEDFPNHAGLETVLMSFAGRGDGTTMSFAGRGDGTTELTIPDGFVFAGNGDPATPVRIEGGAPDTLRFDMEDFTEGDRVTVDGEEYRSFAADNGSWSFLIDTDVMLFDL